MKAIRGLWRLGNYGSIQQTVRKLNKLVELTPELNSGQALQGFINWFKQAKTISSLKAFQFSDSLVSKIYSRCRMLTC
jgi:hypothetical protein